MMALYLILLFALVAIVQASMPAERLTPRLTTDDSDFTFKFCDTNRPPCASCPGGAGGAGLVDTINPAEHFGDLEITLTQDELDTYRALNMEYVVEFSKNPPYAEKPLDLPFCHIDQARRLSKRFSISDLFGKPPQRPVFKPRCLPTNITVRVFFNIITSNSSNANIVTDEVIAKQLQIIQEAFEPVNIFFVKAGVRRDSSFDFREFTHQKLDPTASEQADQDAALKKLKQGGYDDINIYIVEQIDDATCNNGKMVRTDGYCRKPDVRSPTVELRDGCYVDIDSLPGVTFRGTDKVFGPGDGTTLVHEIGHWFGLEHVFHSDGIPGQDSTCKKPDYEGVDTPIYKSPPLFDAFQKACCHFTDGTYGECADPFKEHVTNWMSYSPDKGIVDQVVNVSTNPTFPWTTGQMADMYTNFFLRRRQTGGVLCQDGGPMYSTGISFRNRKRDGGQTVTGKVSELLTQPPALLESLKTVCSRPIHESEGLEIDPVTGKLVEVHDGPFEWWYELGTWRWIMLAAIIVGLLIALACCIYIFRRWRRRRTYRKIHQGGEKSDEMRPLHLVQRQQEHEGS